MKMKKDVKKMKTKSKVFALILSVMMLFSISVFPLSAEAENVQITMNTADTNTLIDTTVLGFSSPVKSLGYGESITVDLIVPTSEASIFNVRMCSTTTGQSVYVIITNSAGTQMFTKLHTMTSTGENISGVVQISGGTERTLTWAEIYAEPKN